MKTNNIISFRKKNDIVIFMEIILFLVKIFCTGQQMMHLHVWLVKKLLASLFCKVFLFLVRTSSVLAVQWDAQGFTMNNIKGGGVFIRRGHLFNFSQIVA